MTDNNNDNKKKKIKRDVVIGTRLSEDEFAEMQLKLVDSTGKSMMTPSAFLRAAATGAVVNVIDTKLERYKVFVGARAGNNLNQIARRLHTDNLMGKIDNDTYQEVLRELVETRRELKRLLRPLS